MIHINFCGNFFCCFYFTLIYISYHTNKTLYILYKTNKNSSKLCQSWKNDYCNTDDYDNDNSFLGTLMIIITRH